MFLSLFLCLIL